MSPCPSPKTGQEQPRLNILVLDGGGVRGLSSLLLLEALMANINEQIKELRPTQITDLRPQEIFNLIAGTSTGGLIALMLVKMRMTVPQCIAQYCTMSKAIFGGNYMRKTRSMLTFQLGHAKYSGDNLRALVQEILQGKGLDGEEPMVCEGDKVDETLCAVVCREHLSPSRYSKYKREAASICNLDCRGEESIMCAVPDAARATSAAPTYFEVTKICDQKTKRMRYFSDGGLENNNPTRAIHKHYGAFWKAQRAQPSQEEPTSRLARHEDLRFDHVRYINLGTGTKTDDLQRLRDTAFSLLPGAIRMGVFLKQTLTEMAASAEGDADFMALLAPETDGRIKFERFSADNGVCFIKLYKYRKIDEIRRLTTEYLKKPKIQEEMVRVAGEIADEWVKSHPA
ncbi:MAG: hypothetical protein MMC33_010131 [Icmadophila ericetorum]|nr:hypothetical protein [Icmadophila ericetorum]